MATYDNLNIATTTLTFSGNGNTSIASGTFDLSTLNFLPNVPLIDQIEVERVFDTGYDTKFGAYAFTIADRRQMFIFPKDWYTINEQTKVLTFKDLSTIPLKTSNNLDYPYSRTYTLVSTSTIDIPVVQASYSSVNGIVRQADIVYIRRKTPSINSIVTFAPGTRLTTTQLNLQFDQLKYIVQELTAKFRNEAILKYDENAIDGPFLGQGDLKMNNNYIKDVNSPAFTQLGTFIADNTNTTFNASTFLINLDTLGDAIINGTLHRTGIDSSPPTFTGDYTAGNRKLINLSDGTLATDAATIGQIQNANNITTGTLNAARIADGTLSLGKLSQAAGQNYVLPSDALPVANSLSSTTPTSFGASTGSNTNNMLYASVDAKGRITSIGHRNLVTADLPTVGGVAGTYGDSTTVLTQVTVDSTGRITAASERALTATDIPSVNASAVSGALAAGNLPLVSGYIGTTTTTSIPNSITVDTYGRVTSVSGGSITASNVSDFTTAVTSQVQNNAVYFASGSDAFTAQRSGANKKISNVANPESDQDVVTRKYFTDNSIALSGGDYSAGNKAIKNVAMASSPASTDVATVGYTTALTLYGQTPTIPTTVTKSFASGTADSSLYRYEFVFTNGAADNLDSPTAEMLLVLDSDNKTYSPVTTPTAFGFQLTVGATTKTVKVWVSAASMTGKTLTVRNFGISRIVATGAATASTLGTVSVPTSGGITVSNGAISLTPATASQIGGVTVNTSTGGLTNTSGLIAVNLSDSPSTSSSTTVASSKAVNDLRGLTVLRDGTQAMSGKLTAVASTTSIASLNLPSGVAPNSPVIGDVWNQSGTLKLRTDGSTTKDIAFTDSSITGNAATATTLATGRTISLTGAVTGTSTSFNGSANLSFATTLAAGQAVTAVTGTGANAITATRTVDSVALTLPQNIGTASDVQFGTARLGNITLGANTINTATGTGNLIIDSAGGTTTINDTTSIAGSLTVTGTNTTSLGGAVTLGDSLALSTAAAKIALGNTAALATTSIERIGTASGVVAVGDIVMRTPASRKAYLVSNDTPTTAATANDVIITETALASRISGLSSTYMSVNGAVNSAGSQTFGSSASSGAVFIQTGNPTPATQVTVAANGSVTLEKALTVVTGGVAISAGGLTVGTSGTGNTATVYGPLIVNGTISGVSTPTTSSHAATKGYVDTYRPVFLQPAEFTQVPATNNQRHIVTLPSTTAVGQHVMVTASVYGSAYHTGTNGQPAGFGMLIPSGHVYSYIGTYSYFTDRYTGAGNGDPDISTTVGSVVTIAPGAVLTGGNTYINSSFLWAGGRYARIWSKYALLRIA